MSSLEAEKNSRRITIQLPNQFIEHFDQLKREWGLRSRGDVLKRLLEEVLPEIQTTTTKQTKSVDIQSKTIENDNRPRTPYNLLISKNWIAVIKRSKEGIRGFSINALGFAGYILATQESDLVWLEHYGPEYLLSNLVKN